MYHHLLNITLKLPIYHPHISHLLVIIITISLSSRPAARCMYHVSNGSAYMCIDLSCVPFSDTDLLCIESHAIETTSSDLAGFLGFYWRGLKQSCSPLSWGFQGSHGITLMDPQLRQCMVRHDDCIESSLAVIRDLSMNTFVTTTCMTESYHIAAFHPVSQADQALVVIAFHSDIW